MEKKDQQLPFWVGDQIKAARKDKGITQEELANKIGITRAQLGQWESQKRNPRMRNFKKIAKALEMDPEELLYYGINAESTAKRIDEELIADPCGSRIQAINLLLCGMSPAGLDKVMETAIDVINEGGDYLLPPNDTGK